MSTKKAYKKPSLTKVELRPDEAVLTACKLATGQAALAEGAGRIETVPLPREADQREGTWPLGKFLALDRTGGFCSLKSKTGLCLLLGE